MTSATEHSCSDGQPAAPGTVHYEMHRKQGTEPCPASRYAVSWNRWKLRHPGRDLDEYHTRRNNMDGWTCSDGRPDAPGHGHYRWHRTRGTDPCGESRYAVSWHKWTRKHPERDQDDYHNPELRRRLRRKVFYECSDGQPSAPGVGHYFWHRRYGTDPCPSPDIRSIGTAGPGITLSGTRTTTTTPNYSGRGRTRQHQPYQLPTQRTPRRINPRNSRRQARHTQLLAADRSAIIQDRPAGCVRHRVCFCMTSHS